MSHVKRGGSEPAPSAAEGYPPRRPGKGVSSAVGAQTHRAQTTDTNAQPYSSRARASSRRSGRRRKRSLSVSTRPSVSPSRTASRTVSDA